MSGNYQSFPGVAGDSRTLDKLKALQLPVLAGKSFLDVGCNEGFFCGFAKFLGARQVVGIDHAQYFIQRARERFPDCEFHKQGWNKLPKGRFDVILLASALHYADDQPALIEKLVAKLAPGGVLVLELGIVSSVESEWVRVKRGIDERYFPTMPLLRELLAKYAWKWMGPSITQDGDPVKRHVLHISRRLPVAYLLLEPPGFGKTTIARGLFPAAGVQMVSGDQLLGLVARGKRKAPKALRSLVAEGFSPFQLDQLLERIFAAGLGAELVALWLGAAGEGDFALDVYVPEAHHDQVEAALRKAGYLPVQMHWQKHGARLLPRDELAEHAEAFYLSMAGDAPAAESRHAPVGFVDEVVVAKDELRLRGWAVAGHGRLPERLVVQVDGHEHVLERFEKQMRPDVQTHLKLPHALFGYRAVLPLASAQLATPLQGRLAVGGIGPDGIRVMFQFSGPAAAWAQPGTAS